MGYTEYMETFEGPESVRVATKLRTLDGNLGYIYTFNGTYIPLKSDFVMLEILVDTTVIDKKTADSLQECGPWKNMEYARHDDSYRAVLTLRKNEAGAWTMPLAKCVEERLSGDHARSVKHLSSSLPQIATQLVDSGVIATIPSVNLRQWLTDLSAGKGTYVAP